ncbi:aldose epimerase [Mesobacillus campisalis]|uniref:Aldose 1-epimerase n=1 Tax=Mesobacillus campisalis TaxID=1408103 RepID=A0A0M2T0D5_9BACI|nr:aldose epimerase family protein [Mesobacillus campisalis]KKK38692.1 aldose epimerase [Mesobacillus campisalis]
MKIAVKEILGKWQEYSLTNANNMCVSVLDFGGIITKIIAPGRFDSLENVVVSFKDCEDYENDPNFFGALIGRVAGRIQGSTFKLGGKTYELPANNGQNHLHGGPGGFHQVIWKADPFLKRECVGLKLSHHSPDGDGGYPGNLDVTVTYTLDNKNRLTIEYEAVSDATTPLTLTNHTYFNLSGDLKRPVDEHEVIIDSSTFVELDEELIPTGEKVPVEGTPFDFRAGRVLGAGFNDDYGQNKIAGSGYDHYFIFDKEKEFDAVVAEPRSGRVMTVKTTQPGMVMYTGNSLDDSMKLAEGPSRKHLGVCFETQGSPASLHHEGFPGIILKAGEKYTQQTVFGFSVQD